MKYFPLLWSGLWRKRTRTALTLASIMIAFLLFGVLQGVNAAFSHGVSVSKLDRLFVQSKVSFIEPLPISYLSRLEAVPGVDGVAFSNWFGGYYQDPKNFIPSFPADMERMFALYPEFQLAPEQRQALLNTRTGAIAGAQLAKKFGWKIGDHIPLKTTIWTRKDGSSDWDFELVGIFDWANDANQTNGFYFNYSYFDEGRAFSKGLVGWYIVHLSDVSQGSQVGAAIDAMFANSVYETKTQNEKEFTQSFLKQFGDINFMVSAIVGAVFFTLLFLTGNTMMQSVRERVPDFAVLKTLGFTDAGVLTLVLLESLLLCLFAAALGLFLASLAFPALQSVVGVAQLPAQVILTGLGLAVLLALVTGLPPALKVRRLSIVDSLAGR